MIQTLSDALEERGYTTLTPVQDAVTDPGLDDADLLVSAQTGSGKTVGFGLAIGPTILEEGRVPMPASAPLALIVAPTRELAFQVSRELTWLYAKTGASVATCVGGMDMRDERRALERGAHIVVGTPGRLRDHIQRGSLDLSSIRAVVLDEADEMLDLGFREDLEFMLGEAPEDRRTLMFSATVPPMIEKLASEYQQDARRVVTSSGSSQHTDIEYQALRVAERDAENAIINVLRFHDAENAIVFANTRATVNRLTARFANRGFAVVCLSGELSQSERSHALQAMRDGRARVCVATDVAARGIDLPNLELVVHAELPKTSEGLLHRSGRTGRAGRKGISALIVPPKAVKKAERLLKTARVTADWTTAPGAEDILARDEERLLADPDWASEITEEQASFAAKLLAQQSPEAVAAAYLRLYRTRHSAPEELSAPEERACPKDRPVKERAPFGPSVWISLSVGRKDRAEPRWLLPLLLRTGGLDKDAVGAIRVQDAETYVELAAPSAEGFLASLGEGGELEQGVIAQKLDGVPDMSRPAPAPRRAPGKPERPRGDKPDWKANKSDRPRGDKPEWKKDKPARASAPREEKSREPGDKPAWKKDRPAPAAKPREERAAPEARKPAKPDWKKTTSAGESASKPAGKKPFGQKPDAKAGRPKKPKDKPEAATAQAKPRSKASDTSQRFTPPHRAGKGPGKPGQARGTARRQGGGQPPRRSKV
ncbi:ATP-dependent RNA helicase DeaD [Roseivivax halotolerans]|uniref:ATP-dependent RNA helicase DeaD n=1 Tax=Roseivivax halotolerans TaxID=93684 RepID=A0A1I5XGL6_9RHOB|nr:DEAD/DEAH box helicase [Roseivivax halotolerans]SFQ31101.1 ATP-dependent RNA helicase DeaD [Roseivivax halotolerans]